jgi:hypothetical protein
MGKQKDKIIPLLKQGLSYKQIHEVTGASKGTISYHAQKLSLPNKPTRRLGFRKTHDWKEIQQFYDEGHTVTECKDKFGFARQSWTKAVDRGDIVPRSNRIPLKDILITDSTYSRTNLKKRLLDEGLLINKCYIDGCLLAHENPEWNGQPIVLVLDHINGICNDHRLENLRILCSNCNIQTDTFSNRGGRFYK